MPNTTILRRITAGIIFFIFSGTEIKAQGEWSTGFDLVNQYIWRGIQVDNGVNIQPYLMYNRNGFESGVSASTSAANNFNEISFWTSYTISAKSFDVTLYLGDFYYDSGSGDFLNFKGVNEGQPDGAHYLESYIEFSSTRIPVSFLLSGVIWNDPDQSMYAQVTYSQSIADETEAAFKFGMALKESDNWYYTRKAGIINISAELAKEIKVTESFSFPLSGEAVFNPYSESFYVVMRIGF